MSNVLPRLSLAVLAAVIGAAAFPPQLCAAADIVFVADVPLVETDGMPCVEVRIGARPAVLFGIDTGDVASVVDTGAAKAAGLALTALPAPEPQDIFKTALPLLHIGALSLDGTRALVMDFKKNQLPRGMAGTLAYTAFKDRVLQIDYVARRVRISGVLTAPARLPGNASAFSLITFGTQGPPIVVAQGFELGGKPVTAQVDTMYTGSLLIYTRSIPALGLGAVSKAGKPEFFPFTDGGVTMNAVAAPSESFLGTALGGPSPKLYFPTAGVHEPDGLFDATVGLALLKDCVLTLDFHDRTLSVAR